MIKTIHSHHHHLGWNAANTPALTVAPGDSVELELMDASGNRIKRSDDACVIASLAAENANPLTGPVYVDGAEPGDTLVVEIEEFSHSDWGWTAIIPGFGLLDQEFTEPLLHISEYDDRQIRFTGDITLPTRPFAGTIGVSPDTRETLSAIPPHHHGGNMDFCGFVAGTTMYFPVAVEGALFSVGYGHAAQGDGEVCGTAIETCLGIRVKLSLLKNRSLPTPAARIPGMPDTGEALVTTGIGPDLMAAARDAVKYMIDQLGHEYGMPPELAYCLVSCTGNLHIAEVVNAPHWTVVCVLPEACFNRA